MLNYRVATEEDLPHLLALDKAFSHERQPMLRPEFRHADASMPPETMRARVIGDNFRTFVATADGAIVGYLVAKTQSASLPSGSEEIEGRVCDLYVIPERRKQGIASALYGMASEWFDRRGCVCEGLTVYAENPAQALYKAWGFSPFSVNMRRRRGWPR